MRTSNILRAVVVSALLLAAGCGDFFTPRTDTPGTSARFVYVANFNGGGSGSITVFSVNESTGVLTVVGSPVPTGATGVAAGEGPAALITAGSGAYLYSANDGGGVSGFSINASTGVLTGLPGSPYASGAGATALAVTPDSKFLYVANSGAGTISKYNIDAGTGALSALAVVSTFGSPIGLAMHPTGNFLYVAEDADGTEVFSINPTTGALTPVELEPPLVGGRPQAVVAAPGGGYLYVANGVGGVEIYVVNTTTGNITPLSGTATPAGTGPVAITMDRAGNFVYVANLDSNNISGYAVLSSGGLSQISGSPYAVGAAGSSPAPGALVVDPSTKFVYVANFGGSPGVSVYSIDSASAGRLNPATTASAGINPAGIAVR